MGYRIQYSVKRKFHDRKLFGGRLPVLTALCFFAFLLLVVLLWPEGTELLKGVIPVSILDQFASNLLNEESISAAIFEFISTVFL